jgi:hypothetical protein
MSDFSFVNITLVRFLALSIYDTPVQLRELNQGPTIACSKSVIDSYSSFTLCSCTEPMDAQLPEYSPETSKTSLQSEISLSISKVSL